MTDLIPNAGQPASPGEQILLYCAAAQPGAHTVDPIHDLVRQGLDWTWVIRAAKQHGILPLLCQVLESTCPQQVPQGVLNELRHSCDDIARRNFFLTAELLRCLDLLDQHGIAAMPFRGPVLAAVAYGDVTLRQFDDLDILVPRKDVLRARDILLSQGYQAEFDLSPAQNAAYLRDWSDYKVSRSDGLLLIIELHWRLTERYFSFAPDLEQLWADRQPVSLAGKTVDTLSPQDLLLVLCVHGSKHCWRRLSWMSDVSRWVDAHPQLDWDSLLKQAVSLGSRRMLLLGLFLANNLVGTALPQFVQQSIAADTVIPSLAQQVRHKLFQPVGQQPALGYEYRFHMRCRERWRDRLQHTVLLAVTPTPGDWQAVSLPDAFFPMYYPLRPFRLLLQKAIPPKPRSIPGTGPGSSSCLD